MRSLHRWLATIAMLFLLYVAVTGTMLAVSELYRGGPELTGLPPPGGASAPAQAPAQRPPPQRFDAHGWPTNQFLTELHTGGIFGRGAQWVDLFTGLVFVLLSITGPIIYFRMLKARRRAGRRSLFWH